MGAALCGSLTVTRVPTSATGNESHREQAQKKGHNFAPVKKGTENKVRVGVPFHQYSLMVV